MLLLFPALDLWLYKRFWLEGKPFVCLVHSIFTNKPNVQVAPLTQMHKEKFSFLHFIPWTKRKSESFCWWGGIILGKMLNLSLGTSVAARRRQESGTFFTHWRNLCSCCPLPAWDFCETEQRNTTHPLPTPGTLQNPGPARHRPALPSAGSPHPSPPQPCYQPAARASCAQPPASRGDPQGPNVASSFFLNLPSVSLGHRKRADERDGIFSSGFYVMTRS